MIGKRGKMRFNSNNGRIIVIFLKFFVTLKCFAYAEDSFFNDNSKECGGEYSGYQYTIKSPNYPETYPKKQTCIYTLRGSRLAKCDQDFNLQFLDFSLPPSENCAEDYVEIGDRSLYCGRVVGIRRYSSSNNSLVLRFRSSARHGDGGFKILVTTLPCSEGKIYEKNREETTEKNGTTLSNKVITKYFVNGNTGSRKESESVSLLEAENSYPVYRPDIDFAVEDNRKFVRGEVPSPPRVESLDENILLKIRKNSSLGTNKYPTNSAEFSVHQGKLFRESISPKVEIVTPSSVRSIETSPSKISAYLFVPPVSEKYTKKNDSSLRFSSVDLTEDFSRNSVVTPPPTKILLPIRWNAAFRETGDTNFTRNLPYVQDSRRSNDKFAIPAKSYGLPDQPYYSSFRGSDQDIKTGEVLDNFNGVVDCQGKNNLEPDLEVTANFRGKNPVTIDNTGNNREFGNKYYPATTYGSPVSRYPIYTPNGNVDITPSTKYGPPSENYPNDNFPGVPGNDRPNDWLPSANFVPSRNFNGFPNLIPNVGISSGSIYPIIANPGNIERYSDCCNTVYSAQRFLLASPGFPSLSFNGNTYECIYTIRTYSSNTCQMRFNFKFFNHGMEDRYCNYGYVEIDGRRICGCKKGLSIVTGVTTAFPKIISVRYTGYPRTKFNGFLIEVIQEPCSSGYPYLSRSKKDVGNSSRENNESVSEKNREIGNNTFQRAKRNLGYSYPKPNFGLSEDSGLSQSWNSGSSINSHQLWNQGGVGGSLFSPLLACQAFTFFDWTISAKEAYFRNVRCLRTGGNTIPGNYPGYPPSHWVPSNGASGPIIPGYPGNVIPGNPGNWGPGIINPGYPGNGGSGTIVPSYPDNGGPGSIIPDYPGNVSPGTVIPGNSGSGGWNFPSVKCEDVNVIEGIISSPQYPTNYPNNMKKCFRFYKAPDSCQLELAILDFDLENSAGCTKDYVTFSGQNRRYCGRSLAGSKALFDISRSNIVDMCFVSDSFGSGRGFSAGFSQIPCRGLTNR